MKACQKESKSEVYVNIELYVTFCKEKCCNDHGIHVNRCYAGQTTGCVSLLRAVPFGAEEGDHKQADKGSSRKTFG